MRVSPLIPRSWLWLAVCVLVLGSAGCELAMPRATPPDPRFEREYLRGLRRGMSPGAVHEILGAPTSKRTSDGGATWRYEYFQTFRVCVPLMFGIPLSPTPGLYSQIDLRFGPAGLERATLTKRRDREASRVDLLAPTVE